MVEFDTYAMVTLKYNLSRVLQLFSGWNIFYFHYF